MRVIKCAAVVASVLVLLAAGCRGSVPIYNVTSAPVFASKQNPSLDEIGMAIQRAGTTLGWQMKQTKPGHIIATLAYSRNEVAVVDVNYSVKSYSIQYKDSSQLNYDGRNIHRNYNVWIDNLDKGIRAQLNNL